MKQFKDDPLVETTHSLRIEIDNALSVIERKLSGMNEFARGGDGIGGTSGTNMTVEEQVD